jgi:hypothetical protein
MRFRRIALACALVVALSTPSAPAEAHTAFAGSFGALLWVGPWGLGYRDVTLPTSKPHVLTGTTAETLAHLFGANASSCPSLTGMLDVENVTQCWGFDHLRTASMSQIMCASVGANIDKPPKSPAHVGACEFSSVSVPWPPNTISGHCGMASAQMHILYIDPLGEDYLIDLHFVDIGGKGILSGHWWKILNEHTAERHGLLLGFAQTLPPDPAFTPDQSCTNKTARSFLVFAQFVGVSNPAL